MGKSKRLFCTVIRIPVISSSVAKEEERGVWWKLEYKY